MRAPGTGGRSKGKDEDVVASMYDKSVPGGEAGQGKVAEQRNGIPTARALNERVENCGSYGATKKLRMGSFNHLLERRCDQNVEEEVHLEIVKVVENW
jgi:hypothetical protein